jgi:hypothetical protein
LASKYIKQDKRITAEDVNKVLAFSKIKISQSMLDEILKRSKGRKVFLKAVDNSHTKEFNSINDCVEYLNTIASSNKTTLYRYIKSGKPYQGYVCE